MRKDKTMMSLLSMRSTPGQKKKTQDLVSSRFLSESKTYCSACEYIGSLPKIWQSLQFELISKFRKPFTKYRKVTIAKLVYDKHVVVQCVIVDLIVI